MQIWVVPLLNVISIYCLFFTFSDVRTQAMYQMMDECFVGIIFSVFTEDKSTKVSFNCSYYL
jgi:hypothetical protein